MADVKPILRGKIVQAIGDDQIKWLRANQNFARIQGFIDQVERFWSVPKFPPLGYGLPFPFGKGDLGDVTISSNTNLTSGQIREYKNLTINTTFTLATTETSSALMILYVSERLVVDGTIDMDGDGTAGGAAVVSTSAGVAANNSSSSYAGSGGGGGSGDPNLGGKGGDTVDAAGGVAGTADSDGGAGNSVSELSIAQLRMLQDVRDDSTFISWGTGGGSGGADSGTSGAGGDGGGVLLIFARELIVSSTGIITCDGSAGSDGGAVNTGGGGGGGGGLIYVVSRLITNQGSIAAAGGAGGTGPGDSGDGGAGGAGTVILEEIP